MSSFHLFPFFASHALISLVACVLGTYLTFGANCSLCDASNAEISSSSTNSLVRRVDVAAAEVEGFFETLEEAVEGREVVERLVVVGFTVVVVLDLIAAVGFFTVVVAAVVIVFVRFASTLPAGFFAPIDRLVPAAVVVAAAVNTTAAAFLTGATTGAGVGSSTIKSSR